MINYPISKEKLDEALGYALEKIDAMTEKFTTLFPSAASKDGKYTPSENKSGWTQCFYTGILFIAYELTGNEKYLTLAKSLVETFINRVDNMLGMGDHDIGFNFTLSTVAAYKITGDERYLEKSVDAARVLGNRFREKGQFIQLAGDENCENKDLYRLIIDCLMNVNLLFFAGEKTGDSEFTRKGFAHFNTAMDTVVREDGSTFQNFYFDQETGARLRGGTKQGRSDTSAWSRGQSWGVTGVPLTYAYMKNDEIIDKYYKVTDFFLDHLPEDMVAYWDHDFTEGDEPRDSSASAIAAVGLIEATRNMPLDDAHKARYTEAVGKIMTSLIDNYATKGEPEVDGIIKHGTYYYGGGIGIDECCIWGDYFYMEALARLIKPDFKKYW